MGVRQTQATQVFVIPECPSPRKAHPHHDPNEESPESRRLFGAGLGRGAPTYSRRKAWQSQYVHAKTHSAAPPTPFSASLRSARFLISFVLRRDRHKETYKPEVNQPSPITARHPRTHEWRSRPTAEQERNITQAVLFGAQAANSRRDRT